MAAPDISFSGLASGIDTQALISALLAVEQRPIQLMQSRRTNTQNQVSLFNQFNSLLETLQSKASSLGDEDTFLSLKTTLSDTGFFTATAGGTAQAASHEIAVNTLAQTGREVTTGYADTTTTTFGTGTIDITVGTTVTNVSIDSSNNTLQGIVGAINSSGAEVHASIIDDGTSSPYRLVIEGDDTGLANDISVAINLSGGTALTLDSGLSRDGQDSQIVVDGITIDRDSNEIEGAIQGVTLNLIQQTDPGATVRLDVSVDNDTIKSRIQSFVDAYNGVVDFLNQQSRYNETNKTSGPLAGDSTLRSVQRQVQGVIVGQRSDTSLTIQSLAALGVELDNDGKLSIDDTTLNDALASNLDEVSAMFTDATEGVANQLDDLIDQITDPLEGPIKTRKDALQSVIDNLDDSIQRAQDRLDTYETTLVNKFAAFETLMGRLNSQGSFLTSQLSLFGS